MNLTCHSERSEESVTHKEPLPVARDDRNILSLSSISLHHFRNYTHAHLDVSREPVVLTGRNGAGKTNILEAISLLAPGRGIRRARLAEFEQMDKGRPWAVAAHISGMQGDVQIGTGRDPENSETEKRLLKIDGKISKNQADLARHFSVLWLTPQMEQLFNEGASAGRKFLDRLVYSFDAEHASRINEYEFAMRERNKLLSEGRSDPIWLDALEQTMAETGAAIAMARLHTAEHINHAIAASTLSFPKAQLKIAGFLEEKLQESKAALEVEEMFKEALQAGRGMDGAAGRTLIGTHRSEMQVKNVEKQMVAENCSTGEQKALLLSIVLAQARAGAEWHGVVPVLLLDEIASHLDPIRRLELFDEICDTRAQVWMTGTDANLFSDLHEKAQFFSVENGTII